MIMKALESQRWLSFLIRCFSVLTQMYTVIAEHIATGL